MSHTLQRITELEKKAFCPYDKNSLAEMWAWTRYFLYKEHPPGMFTPRVTNTINDIEKFRKFQNESKRS